MHAAAEAPLAISARAVLETKRADCLAQIDAAYASESAVDEAEEVCGKALVAVCGHRCASPEELTIKLRYLGAWGLGLEEDQCIALYKSLLPEGVGLDAV